MDRVGRVNYGCHQRGQLGAASNLPLVLVQRLHMVCNLRGLPVAFALACASADERDVLAGMVTAGPDLSARGPARPPVGDKTYYGAGFEADLASARITLLRPARKGEPPRAAAAQRFKPSRQIIESVSPPSIDHLAPDIPAGRPGGYRGARSEGLAKDRFVSPGHGTSW